MALKLSAINMALESAICVTTRGYGTTSHIYYGYHTIQYVRLQNDITCQTLSVKVGILDTHVEMA